MSNHQNSLWWRHHDVIAKLVANDTTNRLIFSQVIFVPGFIYCQSYEEGCTHRSLVTTNMIPEFSRCSNHNVAAEQWPPQPGLKTWKITARLTGLKIPARAESSFMYYAPINVKSGRSVRARGWDFTNFHSPWVGHLKNLPFPREGQFDRCQAQGRAI